MSRFDHVKFDPEHESTRKVLRVLVESLENCIDMISIDKAAGRSKAMAMTKLEECYMWAGKAVRDDQVAIAGRAEKKAEMLDAMAPAGALSKEEFKRKIK